MVSRFVQQEEVGMAKQNFDHCNTVFFAAAQNTNTLEDIVSWKQERAQQCAYYLSTLTVGAREFCFIKNGIISIERFVLVLLKQAHFYIITKFNRTSF